MTHEERIARIGEAKTALAHRLRGWGVDDPEDKAGEFIDALLHQGWSAIKPKPLAEVRHIHCDPPRDLLEQTRARLRAARPVEETK